MVRSTSVRFILIFLVMFFVVSNSAVNQEGLKYEVVRNDGYCVVIADSHTPHGPITISNSTDFSSQGWPGNGTAGNPFVIEGLSIIENTQCISISHTTAYFEVRNCVISSTSPSSLNEGIYLEDVIHGTIQDCIISQHYRGITLYDSSSCTLTNNTATINYWSGFFLNHSDNCTLTNNTATVNSQFGFSLYSSHNCTLTNNTATSNDCGFYLNDSNNCTLTNNTLIGNGVAIDGWHIENWLQYFSGNTVNNKPLGYFKSLTSTTIDVAQYGQVILVNCSEITTKNGNFANASGGIQLGFCTNCTLINNTATSESWYGFCLSYSNNCTLTNNTATSNQIYGVYLGIGSEYNILYLNRFGNNGESNARDDGGPNSWDDGVSSGNYWMDYNGTGTYLIPGSAGSIDNYPFVWRLVTTTTNTTGDTNGTLLILILSSAGIVVVAILIKVVIRNRRD